MNHNYNQNSSNVGTVILALIVGILLGLWLGGGNIKVAVEHRYETVTVGNPAYSPADWGSEYDYTPAEPAGKDSL